MDFVNYYYLVKEFVSNFIVSREQLLNSKKFCPPKLQKAQLR